MMDIADLEIYWKRLLPCITHITNSFFFAGPRCAVGRDFIAFFLIQPVPFELGINPNKILRLGKNLQHWETTGLFWIGKQPVFGCKIGKTKSLVGNMSGYRCVSDCRLRGPEFDTGPVPYFREDWL